MVVVASHQTTFPQRFQVEPLGFLHHRAWRRATQDGRDLAGVLAQLAWRASTGGGLVVADHALDELLQRNQRAAHEDIVERPSDGAVCGWYVIDAVNRYQVWIGRLSPLEASCDCADYRKAALGACTHILAAVRRPLRDPRAVAVPMPADRPFLRWDPIRPLSGPGEWLERLWLDRAARRDDRGRLDEGLDARGSISAPPDPAARRALVSRLREACRQPWVAEPAVRALVEREWQLMTTCGIDHAELDRQLATLHRPLFDYQREGVRRFFETGRMLLGDDMGLGKTAQAIAIAHVLLATGRAARVLVIVPSPLKWQWVEEWGRFSSTTARLVEGPPRQRRWAYRDGPPVLVMSYEQLRRDRDDVPCFAPDLVILDEAQRIKNAGTQTARCVKQLEPPWRLAMTGTPLENRLDDLGSVFEWVNDMALEPRWRLAPWHSIPVPNGHGVAGLQDLATLRTRMGSSFVRRVRKEVLRQLPPRRDTFIPVAMTAEQLRAHEAFTPAIRNLLQEARRRLTPDEFLRLMCMLTEQRMVCDGLALSRFEDCWPVLDMIEHPLPAELDALRTPKLAVLADLLRSLVVDQGRKVVVFSQWRRMLQLAAWATRDVLAEANARGEYFSGVESSRRRIENLMQFHDGSPTARGGAVRVLWSTDAGAVGLNLQRAASCCINLDLPWNPAVLEQRISRIYRLGQVEPVDVYNLVAIGGIEERIARLLADKQTMFDELFDGTSDSIMFAGATSRMAWIRDVAGATP